MTLRERWRWARGLVSRRSCYRADGSSKQRYSSRASAEKAAIAVAKKSGRQLDAYRCWCYCRKWHIGRTVKQTVK